MAPYRLLVAAAVIVTSASPALAHMGSEAHSGLSAGLTHPLFGADHLLAMVAIGLWAAVAAPRLFWVAPAGFLAGMVGGGIAALLGLSWLGIEMMIVGSVVLFGALALFRVQINALLAFAAAAVFGGAHGAAHMIEMPAGGVAAEYAIGFLVSTALLHGAGVLFGLLTHRFDALRVGQAAGGAVAAAGVFLMLT